MTKPPTPVIKAPLKQLEQRERSFDHGASAVVIGVGNEFRRDDGVGPAVVARLRGHDLPGVRLADCDGETGRLLDLWRGADLAIVIDAVRVRQPEPGRIHRRSLRHPAMVGRPASSHSSDLGAAVELARALDRLPRLLLLYAVEVTDTSFGTGLSPEVAAAAEQLAAEIADTLRDQDPTVPFDRDHGPR